MIYEKWRDLSVDLFQINYKKIKLLDIISYPPAGNDVVEALIEIDNKKVNAFIKYERSKMADFNSEIININILDNYINNIPTIYEEGIYNDKRYIVLSKIDGKRLSEIINNETKEELIYKYGLSLAKLHNIPYKEFKLSKKRIINDFPKEENYKFDKFIIKYVNYLKENKPNIEDNCFVHGDYHYANILWENNEINGIIDFEYSGIGFKEQDIAWALILRPSQKFMDNINDIDVFLKGYNEIGNYDENKLKWCLLNGLCHFYLMNQNNEEYIDKLKRLIKYIRGINRIN